ncbi:DUF202 domain-containing protein [Aeromicrobium wangtongii]|uniref:DUF202 domain-containing protein n=1 Tax=Aeromicrobium wangtongii TaxID=2969247 RepID=A0ABY5MBH9_9ACTN|nr:DUF202 domain-containing protein [Aeromicrobium wangtongii]MCD9197105.1 DUF202 domain-containing protein [Aeromicrobium wangtongii]UUP15484.1 DUF202 domain-containing protein [Aeromicrobium wangtongii]
MPRAADGRSDPPVPSDERTTLAWERTALSLFALLAATVKHTSSLLGPAALLLLAPVALLSVWVLVEGWRRYDDDRYYRVYRAIGGPTFVLAFTIALAAVVEMAHLLTR